MLCFIANRKIQAGVTVIELMVTLSIAVVLMTVAVPEFSELVAENRRVASLNQLMGALNMARSEAVKRGARVTICKSKQANQQTPVCDASAEWQEGWLVFLDNANELGNELGVIDGSDLLMRVDVPDPALRIETGANYARGLYYDPSGVIWGINSTGARTFGNDTFKINAGEVRICLTINKSGRASFRKQGETSCRG